MSIFSYRNINILDCETETDLSDMRLEDLAAIPFFFSTEVGEIDGLAWQTEVDEDIRLRFNPIKCQSGKSNISLITPIAQLVERAISERGVLGSNPGCTIPNV